MCKSSSNLGSLEIRKALSAQRKRLKIRLYRERRSDASSPLGPPCVFCGELIRDRDQTAMHEWLIKRNFLPVKLQHLIMHKYNCVLAHNDCHDKHGQTTVFKMRCARAQYKRYGRDKIVAWVARLYLRQTVWIPSAHTAWLMAE